MAALITDHSWRGFKANTRPSQVGECAYMNCRRPRDEHERAVTGKFGRPKVVWS